MADKTIDCKGLNCPMPVIKTKKALKELQAGQTLEMLSTDAGAKSDIPAMLRRTGDELLEVKEADGVITFVIKKGS